ncbi:MAG: S-layer homology domain-containing protein [Clostridia bacterium]|nr:S-layer homology domain-containing protein [Clostridia bacterium]
MSGFKKILSVVLTLIMAIGIVTPAMAYEISDDVAGTVYEEAATVLGALGIMIGDEGGFRPNDTVTRAEFAKIAVHALGLKDVAESSKGVTKFPDVGVNHWANGYINVATAQKIVIGHDTGLFAPEDVITYQEAVTILIRVLGHEPAALAKGGYPTGYLVTGNNIGLTKKASIEAGKGASRGITAQLTYNALTINLMEQVGFGDDGRYEEVNKTLLKDKLGIIKGTGIVTGNSVTKLTGTSSLKNTEVEIGGEVFFTGNSKADHMLGQYVTYYVEEQDNGDKVVLLAMPDANRNKVITINASDLAQEILENSTSIFYYPDEDSDAEELLLADNVNVIYNDKAGALKNPLTGTITLLETTRDDKYDTIFINEYVNYVVDSVSTAGKKIYDKNGLPALDLNTDNNKNLKVVLEDKNGNAVKLEDIKEWNVLSVYKNTNYVKAIVSTEVVSGMITEKSASDETVVIGGKEYKIAENMNYGDFTLKLEGRFYLDASGKIAAYDAQSRLGTNYAYLINAGLTSGLDQSLQIKLFTANGEVKTLTAADKIKVDGASGLNNEQALAALKTEGAIVKQMVTFETNANGELSAIERATDKTASFPNSFEKDMFALNFKGDGLVFKASGNRLNIVDENGATTGSIKLTDETIIFNIAEGETDTTKMEMGSLKSFVDSSAYNVEVFDIKEDHTAGMIRVTNTISNGKIEAPIAVVEKITSMQNSEDLLVDKLYAAVDGEKIELLTEETGILVKNGSEKLEAGDIIQYTLNSKGEINRITVLFDIDAKDTEFYSSYGTADEMAIVYGKVTKKFSNSINVSVNGASAINYNISNATVYKFDSSKNNKLTITDAGEIAKWEDNANEQRVFIRIYKDEVKEIVIVQ